MTIQDELSEAHSFSERTMKYGRNMMAVSVPIIAISVFEAVKLAGSKPFNLNITNEIWVWGFLLAVLIYYFLRFAPLAYLDYQSWKITYGTFYKDRKQGEIDIPSRIKKFSDRLEGTTQQSQINNFTNEITGAENNLKTNTQQLKDYKGRRFYFIAVDVVLPIGLFLWATYAAIGEIVALNN